MSEGSKREKEIDFNSSFHRQSPSSFFLMFKFMKLQFQIGIRPRFSI